MAISQSRMIALIIAARDFQDALESTRRQIMTARAKTSSPEFDEILGKLLFDTEPLALLRDPIGSNLVLEREETHFNKMQNANIQAAKRAALKRGTVPGERRVQKLGPKPRPQISHSYRPNTPESMFRKANISGSVQDSLQADAASEAGVKTIPGLYDLPDALTPETQGIGLNLDTATRAEIDQEIKEEQRLRELGIQPKE